MTSSRKEMLLNKMEYGNVDGWVINNMCASLPYSFGSTRQAFTSLFPISLSFFLIYLSLPILFFPCLFCALPHTLSLSCSLSFLPAPLPSHFFPTFSVPIILTGAQRADDINKSMSFEKGDKVFMLFHCGWLRPGENVYS